MTPTPERPLKVVVDASLFMVPGNRHRGLYRYGLGLLRVLETCRQLGEELEVVLYDPFRERESPLVPEPEFESPGPGGPEVESRLGWIATVFRLGRAYARRRQEGEVYLFPWAELTPWRMPPASAAIVYDLIPSCWRPWAARRRLGALRDTLHGWRLASATRLIAISEATRRDALRVWGLPADQVVAIPHLLPPLAPAPGPPPPRLGSVLEGDRPKLLFLGAREPRKGLGPLLELLEAAPPEDVVLVVAGPRRGYDPAVEARLGRLVDAGTVRVIHDLDEAEKASLLAAAACLLMPTGYEGYGLPVAEAMLLGTPAVTFDNSSLPEVVGEAGTLVPDGDVQALLARGLELARDPALRAAASARARARAATFDQRQVAARYLEVLRDLGARRP